MAVDTLAFSSHSDSVFISYNHEDRDVAERLVSLLVLNGVEVWWDEWNVLIGDNIYSRVCEGVSTCRYLAVLLSPRSLNSRWVQEELDLAKIRELESRSVIVLPLKIEEVELPLALRTKRYADFTDFDRGFRQLMARVRPGRQSFIAGSAAWRAFRDVIVNAARPTGEGPSQMVSSQHQARLLKSAAFNLRPNYGAAGLPEGETVVIYLAFRAAQENLPILVSLSETCREVVTRLAKALLLPETFSSLRANYLLIYEGQPLEMTSTLSEEGITAGATLNLACLTYVIE